MTRMTPFFAASAIVALLALGAGAASAATSNGGGHGAPGPGPSGTSSAGTGGTLQRGESCSSRADQMGLLKPAWQTFVNHCQQTGA